ncbi:MAG: hypothetical protein NZ528_13945 [Caldilineales bacterium]|nr:hypothetical protein [Caldilineales bacterium]MDW8316308.1 hypothetical protein [Anaerolineae bacterium]
MRVTLAGETGLDAAACDRLLSVLAGESVRSAPEIVIDLHGASYIAAYGAACLVLIVQHLRQHGTQVACVLPSGQRAREQAVQLGLVSALRPLVELRNVPTAPAPGPEIGLALSPIAARRDVQAVVSYLVQQAESRLGFDVGDVLDATKVVSELCYNVIDHSDSHGLVAAQVFRSRQGRRVISLAVVDPGIGIRASLGRRYQEAERWAHSVAIEQALGGLSSRPSGGGVGLRSVQAVVRRYGGELVIRSGDARIVLNADRQPLALTGTPFVGTQVGINFSQKVA